MLNAVPATRQGGSVPDASLQIGAHPLVDYTYDALGQRTLTDQAGATTRFTYNRRGQMTDITDPLLQTTHFVYDAAGRLRTRTDRNGQTVSFAYTPSGKTKTITYPDNSSVAFTYTPAWEKVASMTDSLGTSRYTYDAARRLTSQTDANGFTVGYTYDATGNLTTLIYPNNETVSYTYDALNRLDTVSLDGLGQTASYFYDPAGRLIQRVNFNHTITLYGYDDAGRLTGLYHRIFGGKTIASDRFPVLDGNGNRVQEIREAPQVPVSLAVATTHFSYNPPANRLLSTSNTTTDRFTYDAQGQTINKNGTPYSWDDEHRLIRQGGSQYFYDGVGNRLKAINHGITTKYIYDARSNLIAEANASNAITRYYIYGAGLLAMVKNNNVYTYHHDAIGNTVAITNNSKITLNAYSYTPYGQIVDQTETIPQPFKYVGKYGVMTEANGLYYMRARYYDPSTGRFISEDPKGFGGGQVNLYAYVGGNPVNAIDPQGTWVIGAVVGGVAGGVGACLDGCDLTDFLIGAGTGAVAGALSPLAAGRTLMATLARGAALGGASNYSGQLIDIAVRDDSRTLGDVNYGAVIGSALGGGTVSGLTRPFGSTIGEQISAGVFGFGPSNAASLAGKALGK